MVSRIMGVTSAKPQNRRPWILLPSKKHQYKNSQANPLCDIWQLVQNLLHPRQAQNMTQANQCENLRHFLIRILTLTRTQYDREENSYLPVSPWGGEELDHLFSALIFLTLFRVVSSVNEYATCVRVVVVRSLRCVRLFGL